MPAAGRIVLSHACMRPSGGYCRAPPPPRLVICVSLIWMYWTEVHDAEFMSAKARRFRVYG
jgi:hypothetical protein